MSKNRRPFTANLTRTTTNAFRGGAPAAKNAALRAAPNQGKTAYSHRRT